VADLLRSADGHRRPTGQHTSDPEEQLRKKALTLLASEAMKRSVEGTRE